MARSSSSPRRPSSPAWSPTTRALRRRRGARGRVRDARARRAGRGCCGRRCRHGAPGALDPGRGRMGSPTSPTTGSRSTGERAVGVTFVLDTRAPRSARSSCRCPGATTQRTPQGAAAMAVELGVPFVSVQRALAATKAWPVASSSEGRGRRHLRRRLCTPAHRKSRRWSTRRVKAERGRAVVVFSLTAFTRPLRSGATSPTRSPAPISSCSPMCTASTRCPSRECRAGLVVRAVLDATPTSTGLPPDCGRSRVTCAPRASR